MNNVSCKFYLREDYCNNSGLYPIYCRIIINRAKKYYSLNIWTEKKNWSQSSQELKCDTNFQHNTLIRSYKAKTYDLIVQSTVKGKRLELENFDVIFKGSPIIKNNFYDFVKREISINQSIRQKGTIRNYEVQLRKMQEFKTDLNFEDITIVYLKTYQQFLIQKGNKLITTHKAFRFIKAMINRAMQDKLISDNPFTRFKIGSAPDTTKEHLTINELKRLKELYHSDIPLHLKEILRYFLFACYTGLRYRDLENLTYSKIIDEKYIYLVQQKTGKTVKIDLCNTAISYLRKGKNEELVFGVLTDQYTNKKLKEIMQLAGISKNISIHCARHTFACIATDLGIDALVIQKTMGHSHIGTTLGYTKVSDESCRKSLLLFDAI